LLLPDAFSIIYILNWLVTI